MSIQDTYIRMPTLEEDIESLGIVGRAYISKEPHNAVPELSIAAYAYIVRGVRSGDKQRPQIFSRPYSLARRLISQSIIPLDLNKHLGDVRLPVEMAKLWMPNEEVLAEEAEPYLSMKK